MFAAIGQPVGAPEIDRAVQNFGDAGLMVDDLLVIHACPKAGKVTVDPVSLLETPGWSRRRLAI